MGWRLRTCALACVLVLPACTGLQAQVDPRSTPAVLLVTPTREPAGAVATVVPPDIPTTVYRVQAGDTLTGLAERYGLTVEELAALNGLDPQAQLEVGQELKVPRRPR
ncbi:MAG: LysM peptidoglycan-binding domain-containing protein [Chloroflexota bacterium]|nr:LysM peptidoglycan-binding domain-containing protein [Chloroflexota bacterium]